LQHFTASKSEGVIFSYYLELRIYLRDRKLTRINYKLSLFAVRAYTPIQCELAYDLGGFALRAPVSLNFGIHEETSTTTKAQVGRIIANTSGKVFVVRVVGVLFNPLLIKIVRIAIVPGRNAFTTLVAIKEFAHGHDTLSKNKNHHTHDASKLPLPKKITRLASPKKCPTWRVRK